jgi:hypothetical protein
MKALRKYFEHYAETEINFVPELPQKNWDKVLVIPARSEGDLLLSTLASVERAALFASSKVLTILVVNGHESEISVNRKLFEKLGVASVLAPWSFLENHGSDLLVINRATPPRCFQEKDGVGLARKIGCDLALALIHEKRIRSVWIRNTDADVILPEDYFLHLETHEDPERRTVAFVYDFVHNTKPLGHLAPALELYDLSLRYYVEGLKWANSPYAFHTIGSALVVHAEAYAEVRGFPKREAGEDFYLLNKLAKIGKIEGSLGSPIQIQGRLSNRTPFGTGAKVSEITSHLSEGKEMLFYHAEIFYYLREWLDILGVYAHSTSSLESELEARSSGEWLTSVLKPLGALAAIPRLKEKARTPEIRLKQFHIWFDAFRTLKFIHGFRDAYLPSQRWQEASASLSKLTSDVSLRYKANEVMVHLA